MTTPYPGRYESNESWILRCDAHERRWKAEQADRYASAPNSKGLTLRQREKLDKAATKLPDGLSYYVSNDNMLIGIRSENGDEAVMTRTGREISGYSNCDRIYINRACAAVWGAQPNWPPWGVKNGTI